MNSVSKKNPLFFAYLIFITLLFTYKPSINDQLEGENFKNVVFSFSVNTIYILILLSVLFFLLNFRKFNYDLILIILITSSVFGLVPLLYSSTDNYLGNYFPLIISTITYFIFLQSDEKIGHKLYKLFSFVILVISAQVIYSEWNIFSGLSFGNLQLVSAKGNLAIPIGSSNLIACFLLPMLAFVFFYKKNTYTLLICLIGLYALLLCRSKNALIILLVITVLIPFYKFLRKIYTDKYLKTNKKITLFIILFIIFCISIVFVIDVSKIIINDFSFNYFSSLSNPFLNQLDRMSSGRVTVIIEQFNSQNNYYLFGNGFSYSLGEAKSHNWLIDLIVQRGIIGFFLYVVCLTYIVTNTKSFIKDKLLKCLMISWTIILIQGLFEISLFTAGIDFMFWSISGIVLSRVRYLKYKGSKIKQQNEQLIEDVLKIY